MAHAYVEEEPSGLLTGDELLRMPWLQPCELVRGRILPMTLANPTHGRIVVNVAAALRSFVRAHDLGVVMAGDVGVFTGRDPDTVRGPDVLFLSHARDAVRTRREGFLQVAPELVVEVLSPSDRPGEVQRKLGEYFAVGVRMAWVVDPAAQVVHVHEAPGSARRFEPGDVLDGGSVLPGFALPVDQVFE